MLQQSCFLPLGRGFVVAVNGQVGPADGIGQEVIPDERFFAGGGSSVQGYPQDSLSPRDSLGLAIGGEALVVLNNELRFPLWRWLRGVAFLDAGNAFLQPSEINLGQLAVGTGFGLRLVTRIGVIRLDYGVPTANNSSYTHGRLHFSFGQVF